MLWKFGSGFFFSFFFKVEGGEFDIPPMKMDSRLFSVFAAVLQLVPRYLGTFGTYLLGFSTYHVRYLVIKLYGRRQKSS